MAAGRAGHNYLGGAPMSEHQGDAYFQKNETMRIEVFKDLSQHMRAPVMAFFRRVGLPHVYWELIVPALEEGSGLVCAAVRDRPWPPWGIGAHEIHALTLIYPITAEGAGLSNVFLLDEDLGNVGLAAAVYKEALGHLLRHQVPEVSYIVMEGSVLASRTLGSMAFKETVELFLTPKTRYHVYSADTKAHYCHLGFETIATPDLLANRFDAQSFQRVSQWLAATTLGTAPFWADKQVKPEIIPNTGGGLRASQPGGVPVRE
jgi:hypothetical protein